MKKMDMDSGKNSYAGKKRGTFVVKVDHCENDSWQGKVTWAEEEKTAHFRSVLELIKMIDEALAATGQAKQEEDNTEAGSGTA